MRQRLEVLAWALALLLALVAGARLRESGSAATLETAGAGPAPALPARPGARALAEATARVVRTDPFRLERAPAPLGFRAAPGAGEPPPPPPTPRPPLAVQGIAGPPWQAVLEGVPGQSQPVVVRGGEVFGDLRVKSVTRDRVIVVGPDTTWRLSVRNPWQPGS